MPHPDKAEQPVVFTERHSDVAASTPDPRPGLHARRARQTRILCNVRGVNNVLAAKQPVRHAPGLWDRDFVAKSFHQLDRSPADGGPMQLFPIPSSQHAIARLAKLKRLI